MPLPKILEIFKEQSCNINPDFDFNKVQKDGSTRMRKSFSIEDKDFFKLFGNISFDAMDVSDYEDAAIIHNLNEDVPENLFEKFDFIIDGGTFDHIFNMKHLLQML